MATSTSEKTATAPIGGKFIMESTDPQSIFIPEEWTEEQKMIGQTVDDFMATEIHPIIHEIDSEKGPALMPGLLEKAGEMGLLSLHVEQEYGGLATNFNTALLFSERVAAGFSFATTIGAQTSIGSLPIQFYGNKEQKAKYLPKLVTGEWKCSYCLTEPDAGSDANSGKTRVVPNAEGTHYILNGQKMWITNGGFADIFIVFAKVEDDENLSAFIVEKAFGGITLGEEEKKLGIKGSSTVQVFFNDTPVPVENMLGKRQSGFKIALNILNTGRIKLAAGAAGGCKMACDQSLKYALERKQFGKAIAEFGAIQQKIARMATYAYADEAAVYRVGRNIDLKHHELVAQGMETNEAMLKGVREFAIECAIMKVHASESLDFSVDEALQTYGGMGYSKDAGVELAYRDARITRIYEGTNEINRMLSVGELFKRAFKEKAFDMAGAAKAVPGKIFGQMFGANGGGGPYGKERMLIENLKRAFLVISGRAGQKYKMALVDEQEIILNLADILAEAYVAESLLLRIEKLAKMEGKDETAFAIKEEIMRCYTYEAIERVKTAGREAILSFAEGSASTQLLWVLRRLTKGYCYNLKEGRRKIASYLMEKGEYPFG